MRRVVSTFLLAVALAAPAAVAAQDEPLWDELQRRIKSEPISLSVLFQFVGDAQVDRSFPGQNGFSVANFRIGLRGRLDGGFDYIVQSNFGNVLDARIGLTLDPAFKIDAGRFKAPYSDEFLVAAHSIDFVNRSQAVAALAPNRALGVAASGTLNEEFSYSAGVFNGGGGVGGNARGEYMGVARLTWQRDGTKVGLNAARQGDRRVLDPTDDDPSIATVRSLVGADVRHEQDGWLFNGELHIGEGQVGTPSDPWGGYLTLGYFVEENSQLLLRLDHFDTGAVGDERTLLIPGWNLWPTLATELQINVVLPLEGFQGDPQLLVNLQVSL